MKEIKKILLLDIDNQLEMLEHFLSDVIPTNYKGLYRNGTRFNLLNKNNSYYLHPSNKVFDINNIPIDSNELIVDNEDVVIGTIHELNNGLLSTKPFHSIYLIHILVDIFYKLIYDNNPYRELYYTDKLHNIEHINLIPDNIKSYSYIEDIVMHHIPNTDNDRLIKIMNVLTNVFITPVTTFISNCEECLYDIDIKTNIIKIIKRSDIRAIRYDIAYEFHQQEITERRDELNNYDLIREE